MRGRERVGVGQEEYCDMSFRVCRQEKEILDVQAQLKEEKRQGRKEQEGKKIPD